MIVYVYKTVRTKACDDGESSVSDRKDKKSKDEKNKNKNGCVFALKRFVIEKHLLLIDCDFNVTHILYLVAL